MLHGRLEVLHGLIDPEVEIVGPGALQCDCGQACAAGAFDPHAESGFVVLAEVSGLQDSVAVISQRDLRP